MPRKVLRRCTICKNYHASYLVEDPELGTCYLCLSCWKARSPANHGQELTPSQERNEIEPSTEKTPSKDLK